MIPTTYIASGTAENPTHAGVERVVSGVGALVDTVIRNGTRKTVGSSLIAVGTMAAVTAAERAMDATPTGFTAAVLQRVLAGLAAGGHKADVIDLYSCGFEPALPAIDCLALIWSK